MLFRSGLAGGAADTTRAVASDTPSALVPAISPRLENVSAIVVSSLEFPAAVFGLFRLLLDYPANARQRFGGRCSQTFEPGAIASLAGVTTRNCVPSATSTI